MITTILNLIFQYVAPYVKYWQPKISPADTTNGSLFGSENGYTHIVATESSAEVPTSQKIVDGLRNSPKASFQEGDLIYYLRNGALANKELFRECLTKFNVDGDSGIIVLEDSLFQLNK